MVHTWSSLPTQTSALPPCYKPFILCIYSILCLTFILFLSYALIVHCLFSWWHYRAVQTRISVSNTRQGTNSPVWEVQQNEIERRQTVPLYISLNPKFCPLDLIDRLSHSAWSLYFPGFLREMDGVSRNVVLIQSTCFSFCWHSKCLISSASPSGSKPGLVPVLKPALTDSHTWVTDLCLFSLSLNYLAFIFIYLCPFVMI